MLSPPLLCQQAQPPSHLSLRYAALHWNTTVTDAHSRKFKVPSLKCQTDFRALANAKARPRHNTGDTALIKCPVMSQSGQIGAQLHYLFDLVVGVIVITNACKDPD